MTHYVQVLRVVEGELAGGLVGNGTTQSNLEARRQLRVRKVGGHLRVPSQLDVGRVAVTLLGDLDVSIELIVLLFEREKNDDDDEVS